MKPTLIIGILLSSSFACSKVKSSSASITLDDVTDSIVDVFTGGEEETAAESISLENLQFRPVTTDIARLIISTSDNAAIANTETYITGQLKFQTAEGEVTESDLTIKGRGNSTWGMPKKPYRIKLPAKLGFQGMPADKDWVLLANYSDKSLLRTSTAFELSNRLGMAYTPRSVFVEFYLNDAYQGVYQLTENIKIGKSRLNIKEMETTDIASNALTGGYLLEVDQRMKDPYRFISSSNLPFTIAKPEPPSAEQSSYIENYINSFEAKIFSDDLIQNSADYQSLIDVDSFINWYLVSEIMKDNDSADFGSIYIYKDRNKPLAMGPLWDFDISAGNIDYSDARYPEGWWIKTNTRWYSRLFLDPNFTSKVKLRWNAMKAQAIDTIPSYIDSQAAYLNLAQSNNFSRWTTLKSYVWPNAVVHDSYEGEVNYLKDWYVKRIAWLDKEINLLP